MTIERRATIAAALAASLACGPGIPGETTGEPASTSSETSTSASASSGLATSTTGEPATTVATATTDVATTDVSTTGATSTGATTDASSTGPPRDTGQCIADPAAGICSESCDYWNDCCRCEGQTIAIADPQECTITAGIVTEQCPWGIWGLRLDGQSLEQGWNCADPGVQWTQNGQDGDIVIELCGDTCAAYLDGKFTELRIDMFCEVA